MNGVTSTYTCHICASPGTVVAALQSLTPFQSLSNALEEVGLAEAVSIRRAEPEPPHSNSVAFRLTWSRHGVARMGVTWSAALSQRGHGESVLTVTVNAAAADERGAGSLLRAWPLLCPIIDSQTARMVRAICEMAEQGEA